MRLFFWLLILALPLPSWAFPEMIRMGYVNCTACHVSPAGGGVLTPYGRGLSAELLSTWGSEKEAQPLHGLLPADTLKDWLLVGGDVRGLQYHYENNLVKDGQWINMQALLEAAVKVKNWTLDLTAGKFDSDSHWRPVGTHYWLMDQVTDLISIRAGRFIPQFGLNIPEHISPTRSTLGFGEGDERDSGEIQYADENWTVTGTYSQAPQDHQNANEKAVAFKVEKVFSDTLKPGISYWRGENDLMKRQIVGVHGLLGFTSKFFWLTEWDWQEEVTKSSHALQHLASTYQKWGYEIHKGLVGLIVADAELSKLESPHTQVVHYGAGVQFFPRPHFEIEGVWTREKNPQITSTEGDYAWLLLHYYL